MVLCGDRESSREVREYSVVAEFRRGFNTASEDNIGELFHQGRSGAGFRGDRKILSGGVRWIDHAQNVVLWSWL
jgi:hypothetical protein